MKQEKNNTDSPFGFQLRHKCGSAMPTYWEGWGVEDYTSPNKLPSSAYQMIVKFRHNGVHTIFEETFGSEDIAEKETTKYLTELRDALNKFFENEEK